MIIIAILTIIITTMYIDITISLYTLFLPSLSLSLSLSLVLTTGLDSVMCTIIMIIIAILTIIITTMYIDITISLYTLFLPSLSLSLSLVLTTALDSTNHMLRFLLYPNIPLLLNNAIFMSEIDPLCGFCWFDYIKLLLSQYHIVVSTCSLWFPINLAFYG